MFNQLIEDRHIQIKNSESAEYYRSMSDNFQDIFDNVASQIEQSGLTLSVPDSQLTNPLEKMQFMAKVIELLLLMKEKSEEEKRKKDEGNEIECEDCQNYETNLQKLENDIRQHIRLEHQLKLYQQSLQEKIQDFKKENQRSLSQIQQLKKIFEDQKHGARTERNSKLEAENDRLKQELLRIKSSSGMSIYSQLESTGGNNHGSNKLNREKSTRKSLGKSHLQQNKENLNKVKKKEDRKSCEKRLESVERGRSKTKLSTKGSKNALFSEKMNLDRNKEEKKRLIQAKFENRR